MIPIIESIDENKLRPGAKMVRRDVIMLVVRHPSEEKYLYLHNKKFGWNILVQGGVEQGENPMAAAIRELTEETGFHDIRSVRRLPLDMDNVFYAAHKNENRYARIQTYLIELAGLDQLPHEDEAEVLFETYENLARIFGAGFAHHAFLLGVAAGRFSVDDLDPNNPSHLGPIELANLKVSYR
ncbi:MAG: NUDIX hydrolase [Rickettsiales bacterium]|nr:NUDIX hydrolase [Rickettsiales bacterium]